MRQINIHEAKTQLSKLVEEAAAGQPFIIAKAGKPMVMVASIAGEAVQGADCDGLSEDAAAYSVEAAVPLERPLGLMRGKFTVPDDFDTMLADEIAELFGEK